MEEPEWRGESILLLYDIGRISGFT